MNTHSEANEIQTELSRELGLREALAIGVGTMIAAEIFTLSGLVIRNVGSAAIFVMRYDPVKALLRRVLWS